MLRTQTVRLTKEERIDLVAKMKSGDKSAEVTLISSISGWINKLIGRFERRYPYLDGDALASEIWFRVYRGLITKYDPTKGALTTYMAKAVWYGVRHVLKQHDNHGTEPLTNDPAECGCVLSREGDVDEAETEQPQRDKLAAVMARLNPRNVAITMRRLNGEGLRVIGLEYGISKERVRQIVGATIDAIKTEWGSTEID